MEPGGETPSLSNSHRRTSDDRDGHSCHRSHRRLQEHVRTRFHTSQLTMKTTSPAPTPVAQAATRSALSHSSDGANR